MSDTPVLKCAYCNEPISGGAGGWYSLVTTFEVCSGGSHTSFHEPERAPATGEEDS